MRTMIRILLLFSLTCLVCQSAQAQFLGGFFSQQSRQRKLMVTQIAQYEIYSGALKTGYHITETVLNMAQRLKNSTFTLHSDYIHSLSQVNPVIRHDQKGSAIADLDQRTLISLAGEISWQQAQKLLTAAEISYLQKVRDNLAAKCQLDMDELLQVLTPGKLQLADAQRLQRMDKLYDSMKDKFAFACSFTAKCRRLALARRRDREGNDQMKRLYGMQ